MYVIIRSATAQKIIIESRISTVFYFQISTASKCFAIKGKKGWPLLHPRSYYRRTKGIHFWWLWIYSWFEVEFMISLWLYHHDHKNTAFYVSRCHTHTLFQASNDVYVTVWGQSARQSRGYLLYRVLQFTFHNHMQLNYNTMLYSSGIQRSWSLFGSCSL